MERGSFTDLNQTAAAHSQVIASHGLSVASPLSPRSALYTSQPSPAFHQARDGQGKLGVLSAGIVAPSSRSFAFDQLPDGGKGIASTGDRGAGQAIVEGVPTLGNGILDSSTQGLRHAPRRNSVSDGGAMPSVCASSSIEGERAFTRQPTNKSAVQIHPHYQTHRQCDPSSNDAFSHHPVDNAGPRQGAADSERNTVPSFSSAGGGSRSKSGGPGQSRGSSSPPPTPCPALATKSLRIPSRDATCLSLWTQSTRALPSPSTQGIPSRLTLRKRRDAVEHGRFVPRRGAGR